MSRARPRARRSTASLFAALLVALIAAPPDAALASGAGGLTGLHVVGGESWQAENHFQVEWDPLPPRDGLVHYAIRTAAGEPIPGYGEQETEASVAADLRVPPTPGTYLFEAWPPRGARSRVSLRFDDVHPAPVSIAAPAWAAAGEDIRVRLARRDPPPASGIAGFAMTLDDRPEGRPCAVAGRCDAGELTLRGGLDEVGHVFRSPPEGISFVHAVAVSGSGMASTVVATARIAIDGTPPQVRLEGVPAGWSANPVRVTAVAVDPLSGMAATGPGGPITALALDGGAPLIAPGAGAGTLVTGEGVHTIEFYGRDAVGNSGDGSLPFAAPGTARVRIDESGPTVRFAAADPADPERIEATIADPLSGPDPDRGSIEVRRVGSSRRFEPLPTEVRRGGLTARWSSDDYPRGAYEFRAIGFDAAGNSTASTGGEGGAPFVLQNPVKREARLAFGFGAGRLVFQRCARADGRRRCHRAVVSSFERRPAARTVPCCHGALVGGRLVDAAGRPLPGQTVEVVEAFADGARNDLRRTALATDADGRFSTRLAPGPSREVTAEFPGTRRLTRVGGRVLRLRVRAAVHLRVSTARAQVGGAPVVFSGRIAHPEARLPASGLPVELEFRLPGMAWTEFRTVQSDALGRFRYPYSFNDDDSAGVRFLFRALVPAAGDWPFAPAASRPLAVTG
ncbi:MAG TPA: carboxypeptidase regulatory-like domain-containing protein [Solirubrobacterales bacterium]|nr:carboxypeptidase regulatory-like domain-containing protein [Solirubrobacterales bacterium]